MAGDYFEDRTTFEERFCEQCNTVTHHRVLSRWGTPPAKGRKNKIPKQEWEFEQEINSICCSCFPQASLKK